jgi:hypothetical protein
MATNPHSGEAVAVRPPDIYSPKRFRWLAGGEQGAEPYVTVQSVYESQEWSGGAMPQF